MKEIKIEHLSYLLKQAKANNKPQPIFFLGAGASRSGGIPLAGEISSRILTDYSDSPFIKDLPSDQHTYAKLMSCLLPEQRDELLKKYIDAAKVNVAHIYLAQLIKQGYVDYVLTVNFDNLMLRALAFYNIFPSTYDMAILKDLTTSSFKEKSVVYLHGQHHGLWLLNTPDEMEKVKNTVPRIFDSISNKRPWVFIGYSGEDPIFDHIKKLGRFDNGLYWITYGDTSPIENVRQFLSDPNTNAFVIKGYDADSFTMKLNSELGLEQPVIIDKPFTALRNVIDEIVDIDDQDHFKDVKERLSISKNQVKEAIKQFEKGEDKTRGISENRIDVLKKEIINLLISEKYDEKVILGLEQEVKEISDKEAKSLLAKLYSNWGIHLGKLALTKVEMEADNLYQQSFDKYRKSLELIPDDSDVYHNWGIGLWEQAATKEGLQAESLSHQSFEKYQKAIELNPNNHQVYINWGAELVDLAKTKEGEVAEDLYHQCFEKYLRAIEIKPDYHKAYFNWGTALGKLAVSKKSEDLFYQSFEKLRKAIEIKPDDYQSYHNLGNSLKGLAKIKEGNEAEDLFHQSCEKYRKAIEINPNILTYNSWGKVLGELANIKEGKEADELYHQAFEKYQKAIELQPDNSEAYDNWGIELVNFAKTKVGKEAKDIYQEAIDKCQRAFKIGGHCYNLACVYAILENKEKALQYLDISLSRAEVKANFVKEDQDWKVFISDHDFIRILNGYN